MLCAGHCVESRQPNSQAVHMHLSNCCLLMSSHPLRRKEGEDSGERSEELLWEMGE